MSDMKQSDVRYETPRVNIHEDSDGYVVEAALPGVDEASVDVSVEDGVMTLAGVVGVKHPEGARLLGGEFSTEAYRRSFQIPDQVDVSAIKANMRHGLLRLSLPKREELKTRKIAINAA